jgi:uncharacterized RDD family membrane protein YckC
MDPFEEFEFKPLTEGLGFHNPNEKPTLDLKLDLDLLAPDTKVQIQAPLPRNRAEAAAESLSASSAQNSISTKSTRRDIDARLEQDTTAKVDEILRTLGERKKYEFSEPNLKTQVARTPAWSESKPEVSATLLDAMLIFATYLASLIVLLMITKVDLFSNLMYPDSDRAVFIGLAALLGVITWTYLVANRIFMGYTPGEWVFDQRLGLPQQLGTAGYSLKVAARSLLVIATGLVAVPMISWIMGRDVVGNALGLTLMRKV